MFKFFVTLGMTRFDLVAFLLVFIRVYLFDNFFTLLFTLFLYVSTFLCNQTFLGVSPLSGKRLYIFPLILCFFTTEITRSSIINGRNLRYTLRIQEFFISTIILEKSTSFGPVLTVFLR